MKRNVGVIGLSVVLVSLVVASFLIAPSRAQMVQTAKGFAKTNEGIWIYEGPVSVVSLHDESGSTSQMGSAIRRPGSTQKNFFRYDPVLNTMQKGTTFKLVLRTSPEASQNWVDYLEVEQLR